MLDQHLAQLWNTWGIGSAEKLTQWMSLQFPAWSWAVVGAATLFFLMIGGRLRRLGKEESAIWLRPLRGVGSMVFWAGVMSVLALFGAFLYFAVVLFIDRGFIEGRELWWNLVRAFWPDRLDHYALGAAGGLVLGLVARWWAIGRLAEPALNRALAGHTRQRKNKDRLTDIRAVDRLLPNAKDTYDPRRYFRAGDYFVGLDEHRQPIYIPFEIWSGCHIQLKGATRTGKGVNASNLGAQGIGMGNSVIVLDPKGDMWIPHVLRAAAKEAGVNFHVLDLRPGKPPQFNILSDVTAPELELLLDAGLGFEETGNRGSDYYSKVDRRTLRRSVKLVEGQDISLPEMCARVRAEWEELEKDNSGFLLSLEEVADLSCLHTRDGFDFEAAIEAGDVVYVIGDMLNTRVVKLQKMILLRLLQLVNRREDSEGHRLVTIYLDEFKYFLSRIALNALGTVLHKGCNVVLSHQTDGDLRACPGIDPEEVTGVVQANAQIRIFFRQDLPEDAARAAAMTGLKLIDKERRKVGRNEELAEVVEPERMVDEVQSPLYDTNIIQSLPPRCAVVFTPGEQARLAITSPYICERKPLTLTVAPPLPEDSARQLDPEAMI